MHDQDGILSSLARDSRGGVSLKSSKNAFFPRWYGFYDPYPYLETTQMLTQKVKTLSQGDIRIVDLSGEFVGGAETDDLREALAQEARDEGVKKLLIDLAGATYLNSTALGVLIAAHTSFSKRGGTIALCNVSKNIENIFVITKLTLVFTIHSTREAALAVMEEA